MRLPHSSVGAFAMTSLGALFPILGAQLLVLLLVHLPLPAFSTAECDSQCLLPALPVLSVAVGVVFVALSSPSLKVVALPKTNLILLHGVRYQQWNSVIQDYPGWVGIVLGIVIRVCSCEFRYLWMVLWNVLGIEPCRRYIISMHICDPSKLCRLKSKSWSREWCNFA